MQSVAPWGALLLLGIFLVVIGFEGSAGRLIAVVFTPRELVVFPQGFPVTPGSTSGYGGGASGNFGPTSVVPHSPGGPPVTAINL